MLARSSVVRASAVQARPSRKALVVEANKKVQKKQKVRFVH
jgi:hypothetical protein